MKKIILYSVAAILFTLTARAQTSFPIDYDFMDNLTAMNEGADYRYIVAPLNSAYTSANAFSYNWAEVRFDSIVSFDYTGGTVINTYQLNATTIRIDSISIVFAHKNTSGTNNTITASIYRGGAPSGATGHSGTQVWTNSINTSTSLSVGVNPNGVPNTVSRSFFPALTLAQGEYYSLRLSFTGNVSQDTLYAISGFRDDCNNACFGVPAYIRNSYSYYNGSGAASYLIPPVNPPIYFDCNTNGTNDANLCEGVFMQNFTFRSYVTVTTSLPVFTINPTASSNLLCNPQSITLNANAIGGTGLFTYSWSNGSTSASPTVNVSSTTTYSVTVTDLITALTKTGSVTVNVRSISVNAGNDQTVACPTSVTLSANVSGTTTGLVYQWSTGSSSSSTVVSPTSTTNYSVSVVNTYGCTAIDVVMVTCSSSGGCNAPSPIGVGRFTPDYDAINCISQNQAYSQVVYFEAPTTISGVALEWVRFDSIGNLPCGISWSSNKTTYNGGEVGCITFSGTSNDLLGSYNLSFYVTVKVSIIPNPISGEMNALLQQFGSPTIDYYLKVKAPAASCLAVSSLTARNSPCNTGTGPGPDDYYVSMGGTHNICNGYFYDSGGPTNDYSSNEDYTITFTASTPGSQIKIVFAWFEVNFGDLLRVYDGPTIFSPLMTNLTGFSIPNNLVSTSGSLTFRFTSASFSQESGWESQVSCITNSLAVNSSDYEICKGESIQLAATATGGNGSNYTYSWSPTATLSNSSVAQPIATPINTTNYTVTVSDGTSSVTATSSVTVHNPPSVNAGPDKFISDCAGTTNITATASGSVVYSEWDNGFTGLNNPAAHQGINTIYVEDNNGCIGSDEVTVFLVGSSQIVSFAASPTACTNSPITFTNTSAHLSGWTWRWEFGDASNATTSSAIHSYTSPGFYTVTLRGDSLTCQISFEQEVEINQCTGSLSVSVSGANQACKGGSTTLTAIVSGGSGSYNYYWTPDNFGSAFNQAYTVSPNSTTTFSVYVTDLSGNSNIASHTVTVNPSPLVDAGTDAYICPGGAAQISATTDIGTSFSWQPAIGLSCSNCANPMATPSATTTYSLTVIGQNGCSGYDDVVVYLSSSAPASVTVSSIPEEPCGGQNVQLTALLVNGGTSPAISWKRNGSVISTNSSITGQFDAGDIVTVDITSNLNCANPKDASFSINIPACVGIAETFTFGNISIYPNPNEGNFVLQIGEYPSRSNLMIELITTDGKQIYREQLQPQSNYVHNMHFEKLAAGIYLLRVSNSDGQIMKRIAVY